MCANNLPRVVYLIANGWESNGCLSITSPMPPTERYRSCITDNAATTNFTVKKEKEEGANCPIMTVCRDRVAGDSFQ